MSDVFSDLKLRALQPPSKGQLDVFDASLGGFGLRVSQGGSKTFFLKHRNRRITIGRFPLLSLAVARQEARRMLAEFTLGRVRPTSLPYREAVDLYLEEKGRTRRPATVGEYRRSLSRLPFKTLAEIDHAAVTRVLKGCTKAHEFNHRLIALKIFLSWCKKRRYVEHNAADGFSKHAVHSRSRVLTDEELGIIWRVCGRDGPSSEMESERSSPELTGGVHLPANFATIVKILILTGLRRGEAAQIQSSWIQKTNSNIEGSNSNLLLTIPAKIAKNARELTIPLGPLSGSLLETSMADHSVTLFPARTGEPYKKFAKASAALWKLTGIKGACLHDIRRTYRSNLSRCGILPHLAERLVGHVSATSAMERVYDRHSYLPELRDAVEKYETWFRAHVLNAP